MTAKPIYVPEEVIRAYDVVRNVRAGGRVNTSDHSHAALLECIERQQEAIQALFRQIADLQRAEQLRREDAAAPVVADGADVPAFLADRVPTPRHGSYWTREEASAADDVKLPLCIHGNPRNVFCGRCES